MTPTERNLRLYLAFRRAVFAFMAALDEYFDYKPRGNGRDRLPVAIYQNRD